MSLVDILILVILALFLLKGAIRGLLKEVCSLLGLILGGAFAFTFHLPLAQHLQDSFDLPARLSVWGAFLGIFILVVAIFAVLGFLLNRFVKLILLGGLNRLTGALFGLLQGVVILAMVILALGSSVAPQQARDWVQDSQLAPPFAVLGTSIYAGSRELVGR